MYSVKRSVAAKVNWNLTVNILEDWTLWIWDSSSNTKSEQCFNLNFFSSFSEICLLPKIFTEREEIVSFVGQATIDFFSRLPPACLDLSFFQLNVLKPFKAKWQEISFLDYVSFAMVFHNIYFLLKKIKNFFLSALLKAWQGMEENLKVKQWKSDGCEFTRTLAQPPFVYYLLSSF